MNSIKEILATPCKQEEIARFEDGTEYIPTGICENILDEVFDFWELTDFKFQIVKTGNFWFASGSAVLIVSFGSGVEWPLPRVMSRRSVTGACTMVIASKDDNKNYEATVLSFCLVNAAKKLGKRFGRHLNDRTVIPESQVFVKKESDDAISPEEKIKSLTESIGFAKSAEELQTYRLLVYTKGSSPDLQNLYEQRLRELKKK